MNILFMCVANSARSQMAEGLARSILGPGHDIQSAGSHPGKLNPFAIQAMEEIDIDISKHYSRSINDLSPHFILGLDCVITLCDEEVCPMMVSKAKRLSWPLADPARKAATDAEQLQRFREARDVIRKRLEEFKKTI